MKTSVGNVRGRYNSFVRIKLPSLSMLRRWGRCRLKRGMARGDVFMSTLDEACTG